MKDWPRDRNHLIVDQAHLTVILLDAVGRRWRPSFDQAVIVLYHCTDTSMLFEAITYLRWVWLSQNACIIIETTDFVVRVRLRNGFHFN